MFVEEKISFPYNFILVHQTVPLAAFCLFHLDALSSYLLASNTSHLSTVQVEDARRFVRNLSLRQASVSYLHLAEGAPSLGGDEGPRVVGKTLAYLASDFMECREARRKLEK